jgi:hypothetical protein
MQTATNYKAQSLINQMFKDKIKKKNIDLKKGKKNTNIIGMNNVL